MITRLKKQHNNAAANWRAELSKIIGFLDIGVRQKLLSVIPAYAKHGINPGREGRQIYITPPGAPKLPWAPPAHNVPPRLCNFIHDESMSILIFIYLNVNFEVSHCKNIQAVSVISDIKGVNLL